MESSINSVMHNPKHQRPEKPPVAKPVLSRWISDDDPKPSVNVNYSKVPSCRAISGIALFDKCTVAIWNKLLEDQSSPTVNL